MTETERTYLGKHRGEDVWAIMRNGAPIVQVGTIDLAYPIDLNGTFKRWVDRRVLLGGSAQATAN